MLHGLSRAIHEEVRFDTEKVTSVDWVSHPTLRHADAPERIDVVLVNGDPNPNRPDLPPYGAGEAATKPMLAAIANANPRSAAAMSVSVGSCRTAPAFIRSHTAAATTALPRS